VTTIRPARAGEAELLQAICLRADRAFIDIGMPGLADDPFPLELLRSSIDRGRIDVAIDDDDEVVGWILVSHAAEEPCIAQIAVEPSSGRRGVGTQLVEHACTTLRATGHASVVLNTERDVPWNAPWYARLGFEPVAPEEWTDDMREIAAEQVEMGLDWATRVHMRRFLLMPA
jgi:predicted N-acetyltransferase YhbS